MKEKRKKKIDRKKEREKEGTLAHAIHPNTGLNRG